MKTQTEQTPTVESAFAEVLKRAKDYGMPHVKLPIDAAEQVLAALRASVSQSETQNKEDHSAGLIGQPIPDMEGTEPRLTLERLRKIVREYHDEAQDEEEGGTNAFAMERRSCYQNILEVLEDVEIGSVSDSASAERADTTRRSEAKESVNCLAQEKEQA